MRRNFAGTDRLIGHEQLCLERAQQLQQYFAKPDSFKFGNYGDEWYLYLEGHKQQRLFSNGCHYCDGKCIANGYSRQQRPRVCWKYFIPYRAIGHEQLCLERAQQLQQYFAKSDSLKFVYHSHERYVYIDRYKQQRLFSNGYHYRDGKCITNGYSHQ
jgi:hypothetical protein